jgi:hypothetical protein
MTAEETTMTAKSKVKQLVSEVADANEDQKDEL